MQDFRNAIVENVPYLRRYARALANNIRLADRVVQQCLDCAADLHQFTKKAQDKPLDRKIWLFSIFHNIYSEFIAEQQTIMMQLRNSDSSDSEVFPDDHEIDDYHRAFTQLPLLQKQVFLLVSVEKFTYEEASKIVNLPLGAILSLLHTARNFIAERVYSKQAADSSANDARNSIKSTAQEHGAAEMLL